MLGIGTVISSKERFTATFSVVSQSSLRILISIFAKYNLNTTKHLDFLRFSQAYTLYIQDSSREARLKLKPKLDDIINSMNRKRTNFDLDSSTHNLYISANWLLGFVEGEGSFYVSSNKLFFSITQKGNKALLEAIKNLLHQLAPEGINNEIVHVNSVDESINT